MEQDNNHFTRLIEAAIALSREGCDLVRGQEGYQEFAALVANKQARLQLRIAFSPAPSVACEVIRDCDGELVGILFEHQARWAPAN